MALNFNFNNIETINYIKNGTATFLDKLVFDGTTVWQFFDNSMLKDF